MRCFNFFETDAKDFTWAKMNTKIPNLPKLVEVTFFVVVSYHPLIFHPLGGPYPYSQGAFVVLAYLTFNARVLP